MLKVCLVDKKDAGFISVINFVTAPVFTAEKVCQRERFITPFQDQPDRTEVLKSHRLMIILFFASSCDLAGSERVKKTKAEGERLQEAQSINSSLLELGYV